jgi:hypothetical protein
MITQQLRIGTKMIEKKKCVMIMNNDGTNDDNDDGS